MVLTASAHHVVLRVVEDDIRAERPDKLDVAATAHAGNFGPEPLGQLDRGSPHRARGPVNENPSAPLHAALLKEVHGEQSTVWNCSGVRIRESRRHDRDQTSLGHAGELPVAAESQHSHRIDAIARLEPGHVRAPYRLNLAGQDQAQNGLSRPPQAERHPAEDRVGKVALHAAPDDPVAEGHSAGAYSDEQVASPGRRLITLLNAEYFGRTVARADGRLHAHWSTPASPAPGAWPRCP